MFKPTLISSGAIVVADSHFFVDETARDNYFVSHPTELTNNVFCYITGTQDLEQYKTSTTSWAIVTPAIRGPQGPQGEFPEIHTLTEKTTLVDDDLFVIQDSENSFATKKVKFSKLDLNDQFIALEDTPNSYSGQINKFVQVNSTEDGLQFVTLVIPEALSDLIADSTHRTVTDSQITTWTNKQNALGYTPEDVASKGVAFGYCPLGSDTKIPSAYIGQIAVTAVFPTNVQPSTPSDGTVWVNTDTGISKIYSTATSIWYELGNSAGYVTTINGYSGPIVTLTKTDIGLGYVTNSTQIPMSYLDTDITLSANSNTRIPSQKAIKSYVDSATHSGVVSWGSLTGTLSSQTDLQSALNLKLDQNQNITLSGDVSGSGTTSINVTLGTTGVSTGTYQSVTVDAKGRVTAGSNPTTLAGYGISDAQPLDADLTALSGLSSIGFVKRTGDSTYTLDNSTYQLEDPTLTALAGMTTGANKFPYFTATDVVSAATVTNAALSLLDDTTTSAMRNTLSVASSTTAAMSIYVDKAATGTGDGLSWTNAFTTIQAAIDSLPSIIAHTVIIYVRKGSTPYKETVSVQRIVSSGSLTIRGEYYWDAQSSSNSTQNKLVKNSSDDFSNVAVGDTVVLMKYNGTYERSYISESYYGTITNADNKASGYVTISMYNAAGDAASNVTPTTGWRYLILKTEISGSDNGSTSTRNNAIVTVDGTLISTNGLIISLTSSSAILGDVKMSSCFVKKCASLFNSSSITKTSMSNSLMTTNSNGYMISLYYSHGFAFQNSYIDTGGLLTTANGGKAFIFQGSSGYLGNLGISNGSGSANGYGISAIFSFINLNDYFIKNSISIGISVTGNTMVSLWGYASSSNNATTPLSPATNPADAARIG